LTQPLEVVFEHDAIPPGSSISYLITSPAEGEELQAHHIHATVCFEGRRREYGFSDLPPAGRRIFAKLAAHNALLRIEDSRDNVEAITSAAINFHFYGSKNASPKLNDFAVSISCEAQIYRYTDLPAEFAPEFARCFERWAEAYQGGIPFIEYGPAQEAAKAFVPLFRAWRQAEARKDTGALATTEEPKGRAAPAIPLLKDPPEPFLRILSTQVHVATTRLFSEDPADNNLERTLLSGGITLTMRENRTFPQPRMLDILDALSIMATMRDRDKYASEWSTITAEMILDECGIKRRGVRKGGKSYKGCHRREDLEYVSRCVQALGLLQVSMDNVRLLDRSAHRRSKYKYVTRKQRSPFFHINETFNKDGSFPVEWTFTLGEAAREFVDQSQFTYLGRPALKYDSYRERSEKTIAYFLAMKHAIAHGKPAKIKVRDIVAQCGIPLDRERPQRVRDRVERALRRLIKDKVIRAFRYTHGDKWPPRDWLDQYLDAVVEVTLTADNPLALTAEKKRLTIETKQAVSRPVTISSKNEGAIA
jgi:hypothetical protein